MRTGEHQCLVFSLAMLLDEDPDVLIQELGHDGTDKWWPGWPPPYCYRGHHIQEIIDVCIQRGYSLTPIEAMPRCASARDPTNWKALYDNKTAEERFKRLIHNRKGLLIGRNHACAWDGNIVWDPNGRKYALSKCQVAECWILNIGDAAITSE